MQQLPIDKTHPPRFSEKWKTENFDQVVQRLNGKDYQIQVSEYCDYGPYPVIDQGQEQIAAFSDRADKLFRCPKDGLIVFGDHTRAVKFIDMDFVIGADGTQLLAARGNNVSKFFYYQLSIKDIPNTGYNRHFKFLQDLVFVVPAPAEQQAIAEALSDVDGLLEALEALIAKKRNIKQAAMQQLLTGKTRLPGFRGKWKTTTFNRILTHHSGNSTLIKGKLSDIPLSGYFPAYSASGQDVWHDSFEYEGEALIVSAVGSRCGKTFSASGKWSAIANTHVIWADHNTVNSKFLHLYLDDEEFWIKGGSGQPFVQFKQSFSRAIRLPTKLEQTAIASVLSDMGAEIAALERRFDKTRAIKQGMMQQLLTGRVRLIDPEAAAKGNTEQ